MEIMKTNLFTSRARSLFFGAVLVAPSIAVASEVILQKAPPLTVEQAPAYPENVARYHFGADVKALPQNHAGATLELSSNGDDRNTSEAALLCDDPTTGYRLPAGNSTILVSLANIESIESISLLNDGAKGDLTIALSNADVPANSPEWRKVDTRSLTDGAVTARVGPGEAKYVRLTFNVTQPGRVAAFGVYATPAVSDFTMPRPRKVSFESQSSSFALINYNFTDLHVRARAVYASSGDLKQVNKMLDDQPGSSYRFAEGDAAPTAVIDLGRQRSLSRISAIYAAQPGSVDFYVLNDLPNSEPTGSDQPAIEKIANVTSGALPATIKLSEKSFASLKPVGSFVSTNQGRASIDFPATTGRYLMLKWHPATVQGEGFSVAQVAAFGTSLHNSNARGAGSTEMTDDNDISDAKDGKELADGKSILDNKDIPATGPEDEAQAPAEGPPPALPDVPPFTFIPQVTPGSGPVVPPTSP